MENSKYEDIGTINKTTEHIIFDEFYNQYFNRVYKFVRYRVNNNFDAEDITADIFIKVHQNIHSYNPQRGNIEVWLFSIARNTLNDFLRRKKLFRFLPFNETFEDVPYEHEVDERLCRDEEYGELQLAIQTLDKREIEILSYRFGAELSNDEISLIMKISTNNVSVIIHRAIKKLKKIMEENHEKQYG